jgi:carbon-monoxide dehydrogenase medium subunit
VGHLATRNRGTVGGSLAHADPAAELPLALLALGGRVQAAGPEGRREIPAEKLFAGFLTTALRPGELLVEATFPMPGPHEGSALVEVANRHGDFALTAAAAWLRLEGNAIAEARVAVGAVADRPTLVPEAAAALTSATPDDEHAMRSAGEAAAAAVDPIGTLHAPPDYQRHLMGVLVARALRRAAARAEAAE